MTISTRFQRVRPLTDLDANSYRQLRLASTCASSVPRRPELLRELGLYARGWHNVPSLYTSEGGCVWGAFCAEALMGVIAVSRYLRREGVEMHLWGLYVRPEARGSWVARALANTALLWCRRQRPHAVTTQLHRSDHRALRWCRRKGFQTVEAPAHGQTDLMHLNLQCRAGRHGEAGWARSEPERGAT